MKNYSVVIKLNQCFASTFFANGLYKCIGYNVNVMRKSACLGVNLTTVNKFTSLFKYTPIGLASH